MIRTDVVNQADSAIQLALRGFKPRFQQIDQFDAKSRKFQQQR